MCGNTKTGLGIFAQKIRKAAGFMMKSTAFLVRRKGLEPPTYWFVASHSIQLSYRRIARFLSALV